jgi:hypothetical protein
MSGLKMILASVLAVWPLLSQSTPVDVDGDGEIGPLEIIDLSLHWKGQTVPQLWEVNGTTLYYDNGKIGIGTNDPHHQLKISGGPVWTVNGWTGSLELGNAAALGWDKNAGGKSFGIGQSTGGLYFFHTSSEPGTNGSPANYDLTIADYGYVGVGGNATVPAFPLTINTGSLGYGLVHSDGIREVGTFVNSSGGWLGTRSDHPLHFFTKDSLPQMTLATSGSLGIGTSAPTGKLDVRSTGQTPAIRAVGGGSGGTALEISSGAIRVPGAGANTATPAFIHVANGANSRFCDLSGCYCFETRMDHPMTNGNPSAILFVTVNDRAASGHPVVDRIYYDYETNKWVISCSDWFCHGQKFNVLIIKP